MGGAHSHEDLELSDSEYKDEAQTTKSDEEEDNYEDAKEERSNGKSPKTPSSSIAEIDAKLKALKLKYSNTNTQNLNFKNPVKLYLHIGGNTPKAKWVVSEKLTSYEFVKSSKIYRDGSDNEEEDEEGENGDESWWVLKVGSKVRVKVGVEMQLKYFGDQRRVDFVAQGVWALKFLSGEDYKSFVSKFQDWLFENTHGCEATEEKRVKAYGKDFMGWDNLEDADDSV